MARTPIFEIKRRNERELEYMHSRSNVTVEELAVFLGVSEVTVRRDLNYLLGTKMVLRSSAGHYSLNEDPSFDVALFQRYSLRHHEKTQIARSALSLISPGTIIGIDSSTTTLELGKILQEKEDITLVTNNLFIPAYLSAHPKLNIFFAGGTVYLAQNSTEGTDTCRAISSFHYDLAFVSANAFDFTAGLCNTDYLSIDAKLSYIDNAERCIALLDSSKLGKRVGRAFLPPARIDTFITDSGITPEQVAEFDRLHLPLIIAK